MTYEPRVHDVGARETKDPDRHVLDRDLAATLENVVPRLEPAHEQLLAERRPARSLLAQDRQGADGAGDRGVPRFRVTGAEPPKVVQSQRVQRPFAVFFFATSSGDVMRGRLGGGGGGVSLRGDPY